MKNQLLFTAAVLSAALFHACTKDDRTTEPTYHTVGLTQEIRISDIAGDHPEISDVALVARFHIPPGVRPQPAATFEDKDSRILVRMPFDKHETRLVLPEHPPQGLLSNITNDIPEGFAISDTDANTLSFVEIACNMGESGQVSQTLYLGRSDDRTIHTVTYIYCDRPATVTGTGKDWWDAPLTYDLKLEKGWNVVVEKSVNGDLYSNKYISHQMPDQAGWRYGIWIGGR